MKRTRNQRKIINGLEALVHNRFNKKQLEAKLTELFGHKAKVGNITRKDDEGTDYNFITSFDNKEKGIYGYADIYFLKMRRKGHDDATFLVTEVGYEFETFI